MSNSFGFEQSQYDDLNFPRQFTRLLRDYPSTQSRPQSTFNPLISQFFRNTPVLSTSRSIWTDPNDIRMAARQTQISSLPPSELQAQEAWAQTALSILRPCPERFNWLRCTHGYRCSGGKHYVTHEIIAAGRCAWYERLGPVELCGISSHWLDREFELLPDHGYWWVGLQERNLSMGLGRARMAIGRISQTGELGGWEYVQPGPGARTPTLKELGKGNSRREVKRKKNRRVEDYKEAGVRFPKGMICEPGKDLRIQYEREYGCDPRAQVQRLRGGRLARHMLGIFDHW